MVEGLWDSYCLYKLIGHLSPSTANILGLKALLSPPPPVLVFVSLSENSKYSTPFSSSLSSTLPYVNCLLSWEPLNPKQLVMKKNVVFCNVFHNFWTIKFSSVIVELLLGLFPFPSDFSLLRLAASTSLELENS